MIFQMQEGYLILGEGDWQDRSVNMLAANHLPVRGANIVITREPLPAGIGYADYLINQKSLLAKELAKYTLLAEKKETLHGQQAHFLELSWENQGTTMRQMIMVVDLVGNVLNITASMPGEPDEKSRTELLAAMKSFKPGPAPRAKEGAAK